MVFELWHMLVLTAGSLGAREVIPLSFRALRERRRAQQKLLQAQITSRHKAQRTGNEVVKAAVDSLASELEAIREERDRLLQERDNAVDARERLIKEHHRERDVIRVQHDDHVKRLEAEKTQLYDENQRLRKENEGLHMENRNLQDWIDAGVKTLEQINKEKQVLEAKVADIPSLVEQKVEEVFRREDIRQRSRLR